MASIRKTSFGTFEVYGYRIIAGERKRFSKSFKTKADAKKYAAEVELAPAERSSNIILSALIDQYITERTSQKRAKREEEIRLRRLQKNKLAEMPLSSITKETIQEYIAKRLKEKAYRKDETVSPATVRRELTTISDVFNYAVDLGMIVSNPCHGVSKPRNSEPRERIASDEDIQKLLAASGWDGKSMPRSDTELTVAAFLLSCRTGMRSGEMLRIERSWIDGNVIHLPQEATKTLSRRDVALSTSALEVLNLILEIGFKPRIFGDMSDRQRDVLFRKVVERADLGPVKDSEGRLIKEGLHFHDGRATFATWAASPDPETGAPRLDVLALAKQTGHKNLKMLARYYRASAEEIARRLK